MQLPSSEVPVTGWTVRPDGSFDLLVGGFRLSNAYPALSGAALRATGVAVEARGTGFVIRYRLMVGALELLLSIEGEEAAIAARLIGLPEAPSSVQVIAAAVVPGVAHCYRQAHGIGGGSGLIDLLETSTVESFGITGLLSARGESLIIYARDHSRFEQKTELLPIADKPQAHTLQATFRTEGIPLSGGDLALPRLYIALHEDASAGMRQASIALAQFMKARPAQPATYHWCSWYYAYQNFDMQLLAECLDGLMTASADRPLDFIQIDAGYAPATGDWLLPSHRFPGGLKDAFAGIRDAGQRPGIWIGPFMVGNRSQLAERHPDWLLHYNDGRLVTPWRNYGEQRVWGYRDEETYVLDSSNPEAFAYLRTVFRTLREWGAQMFKTDFMYWGLQHSQQVRRHTPGKTSVEYFRDVLEMIRDEIGEESYWLGCIAPYLPFVGFADGMRIAGDVSASWNGSPGTQNMLNETVGSQHFNHVFWQNDPDVLLIRDFHTELTDDEVTSLAVWQAVMGGIVATSDPLHELAPSRQDLWRFVEPSRDRGIATFPFLRDVSRPLTALRRTTAGDDVVVVLNRSDHRQIDRLAMSELGVATSKYAYLRTPSANKTLGFTDSLKIDLRPHAAAVFHLSDTEVEPSGPMVS